jgi:IS4 transposase
VLPAPYVMALYWQRWRIEDAFAIVKRLLGLAYFWSGSSNGVPVQLWATWLVYAVLVDLTDAVAAALEQPYQALSLEMVYRGLYHFTQAAQRGLADDQGLCKVVEMQRAPPVAYDRGVTT